jgi:SAM-dependent methyltransferase
LDHCEKLIDEIVVDFNLTSSSKICEIASNDGYLLQILKNKGLSGFGIEPTMTAAEISKNRGHKVYEKFLNEVTVDEIVKIEGLSDIVIANNVFAHVPDLHQFTSSAKKLLKPSGILILEVQYFGELYEKCEFDTIYHEHFSYFGITSIKNLLSLHQLNVFKIDFIGTHGGSIRVYCKQNANELDIKAMNRVLKLENEITDIEYLNLLQRRVDEKRSQIHKFLSGLKLSGHTVFGYGAAAKANTMLNYCKINQNLIEKVIDNAPSKIGKYLPGSHIPIVSSAILNDADVDIIVILAWNLAEEISRELISSYGNRFRIFVLFPEITEILS